MADPEMAPPEAANDTAMNVVEAGPEAMEVSQEPTAEVAAEAPAEPPAAPAAEEAAGAGPPSAEAERKKGEGNKAFQAKRFPEAIGLYTEAIIEAGASAPGVYFSNRAVCHAALGDYQRAQEDAAEALRRPGGVTKKALFQKARAELKLQNPDAAAETLQVAEAHGLRADVERLLREEATPQAQGQAPAAQRAPVAATAAPAGAAPASGDAAAQAKEAGNAKYKEGAYKEALAEYERALELLPKEDTERRAPLLGNVAAACLMLRRIDQCISVCEQSLAIDPANSKIRGRLATAQVALGEFAAARSTLGTVNGDPSLANAWKLIEETERGLAAADETLRRGEPARALGLYADLETKALFSSPAMALRMGRCYLELKNYPRVLNTTQQVLRANPRNIDALVLRTEALYRNNHLGVDARNWTEALEQGQRLLKEALAFDPDHQAAQALRKRLRLLCQKHAELKEAFDNREFEKAHEVIDMMLEHCHDNRVMLGSLYTERARASVRLKDWRAVIKDVGNATYHNHELVQPYLFRAQAYQALDRHEDAVKELEGLFGWHREQSVYEKLQEAKFLLRKKKRANYYELLGVPSVASQLEIKKGYRERASEWHPDKKGHLDEAARKNAEEMFKRIGEAYEVLTDPHKKELYDKGYDLEGIEEQLEIKKRRKEGNCGGPGCSPGGCH